MIHIAKTQGNLLALSVEGGFEERELAELHERMEEKLSRFRTLRLYLEITGCADTERAFKQLGLHMDLLKDFDRTALVTDAEVPASLAEHSDTLFACSVQGFSLQEKDEARRWIQES